MSKSLARNALLVAANLLRKNSDRARSYPLVSLPFLKGAAVDQSNGWIDAIQTDEKIKSRDGFQTVAVCVYAIDQWTGMPVTNTVKYDYLPKLSLTTKILYTVELEVATSTYWIVCRGTRSIPEFLISLGCEFSFNSDYKMPLDLLLTAAEKRAFTAEKSAIKSSFSRFMNAQLLGKDGNGNEVTLLESPMQQSRNIVKTLKEGYKVRVVGHSVGAAVGNMICMLLGLSRKKFGTCSALYFGPFTVYDKTAAKFVSTTFPGEIENIMCTNDFILRMSSF